MKIYLSYIIVAFTNLKLLLMCPMSLGCAYLPQGNLGVKGEPPYGSLTAYLLLTLISSHNTLFIYLGRFYVRLK